MPKIKVGKDERYPDYYVSDDRWDPEIELTDDELAYIKHANQTYDRAQKILARAWERQP